MLNITNGDCAVPLLERFGEVLPWRDVLHEGPVRGGLSHEELSRERAAFIADAGWGAFADVLALFEHRDAVLRGAARHAEVVLWFEHDLYDQLQLVQVLDWFSRHPVERLSLVCEAQYLGTMAAARAAELFQVRKPVTPRQLELGEAAWLAFRSPHPAPLVELLAQDLSPLPFLRAALVRHLQEFPWADDGLSRTERSILGALPGGFAALLEATREDPVFMGDAVLRWHLQRMELDGWVRRRDGGWEPTGEKKRRFPRWLGGVLVQPSATWRWDERAQTLRT
ncbi:MAG TPA: hypothetical protein VFK84_09845 [Burkholderiales bacterium]|nr:hypothetical protein [Burkholderiales bacterium]